ncbi:hypothetical protein JOC75_003204 [Metabacillus crassostreae]|uniref:hypothetical protein n=1 Tax=Metabacillus crassostreae TaxID=929098 RepID=UPI00195AB82F|nr:hypothetical protein [Metabacillus crassostreae]MBM7605181.1 hypothetical protein [Metabacillus crassostreae]
MDINQLQYICTDLGINIVINNGEIKENKGYYENYHQLEREGENWCYSVMNYEKRTGSRKEEIIKFYAEKEAVKYFFIKVLYQNYSSEIYPPYNPIKKFNRLDELLKHFQNIGISDEFYSFSVIETQKIYGEIEDDKIVVSYIDEKKQKKFTTLPLDSKDGIFEIYRLTYSLWLLKTLEEKYLEKGILLEEFNDEDIVRFIK